MSTIMVIAGGDWQIELIKKAKSMGHYVICSNLYKNSKGFKYAESGGSSGYFRQTEKS